MPLMAMQTGRWIATHSQMGKTQMRKQTHERVSASFVNVGVRLDVLWNVQPHRWNIYGGKAAVQTGHGAAAGKLSAVIF